MDGAVGIDDAIDRALEVHDGVLAHVSSPKRAAHAVQAFHLGLDVNLVFDLVALELCELESVEQTRDCHATAPLQLARCRAFCRYLGSCRRR